jgi:hypothetical protein
VRNYFRHVPKWTYRSSAWVEVRFTIFFILKKNQNLNPQKPRLQSSETKSQPSQTKPPTQQSPQLSELSSNLQKHQSPKLRNKAPTLQIQASSNPKKLKATILRTQVRFFFLGGQYPVRYCKGESAFFSGMRQTTIYILLLKPKDTA